MKIDTEFLKKVASAGKDISEMGLMENIPEDFGEQFGFSGTDSQVFQAGFMYGIAKAATRLLKEAGIENDIDDALEKFKEKKNTAIGESNLNNFGTF